MKKQITLIPLVLTDSYELPKPQPLIIEHFYDDEMFMIKITINAEFWKTYVPMTATEEMDTVTRAISYIATNVDHQNHAVVVINKVYHKTKPWSLYELTKFAFDTIDFSSNNLHTEIYIH